jgi:DNA-binding transcriptional regulator YdaS (Cro superfamily)
MDLAEYLDSAKITRAEFARTVDCDKSHITHILNPERDVRPSPKLALAIESATGGAVSRHVLRPDIWAAAA